MYSEKAKELLIGAYDLHVHSAPGLYPRSVDDFTLAEQMVAAGMKGAVVKCHEGSSIFRANLATKHVQNKATVFGALVLNIFVGGLNPYAVDLEANLGGKIIFMPTLSAANHMNHFGGSFFTTVQAARMPKTPAQGITILDERDRLLDCVQEIIDIVKAEDICIATGHLSNKEGISLCKEAIRRGAKRVVFTHPEFETNKLPLGNQIELARQGVFIEKVMFSLMPGEHSTPPEVMARSIQSIGSAQCVLSTDYGQTYNPPPLVGLANFIDHMIACGMSESDVRKMVSSNPAFLLGVA
jgi:hypothetical protein